MLTNGLALCVLLASCHTPTATGNEPKSGVVSADSMANNKVVMQQDSVNKNKGASTQSGPQTTNSAGSTTPATTTTKPGKTKTRRIKHGSDNQEKLDSIKQSKTKRKD